MIPTKQHQKRFAQNVAFLKRKIETQDKVANPGLLKFSLFISKLWMYEMLHYFKKRR